MPTEPLFSRSSLTRSGCVGSLDHLDPDADPTFMKRFTYIYSLTYFFAFCSLSSAADPAWWASRGVTGGSPARNLSPAVIGQAKHVVKQALAELKTRLPGPAYSALEAEVTGIVTLTPLPTTSAQFEHQRKVLLVGQLKALAAPFYRHLYSINPMWLERQLIENHTNTSDPSNYFPWTITTSDDVNKAAATVGQIKSVFALRFSEDTDGNLLPDFWEYQYFGGIGNSASADSDADGLTNAQESALGTNPFLADSDGDHVNDNLDTYPLNPALWTSPPNADVTAPQIILSSPENAIPLP